MDSETKRMFKKVSKDIRSIKIAVKGCAKKKDLEKFLTKEDGRKFATKNDLKRFATKKDLENLLTKEDATKFATNDRLDATIEFFIEHVDRRFEEFAETMMTKKEFLEIMSNFEDALQEIRDARQNRLLFGAMLSHLCDGRQMAVLVLF